MTNNKRQRQAGELENRLNTQLKYLFRSCKSFDSGQEDEAARIAVTLRILLHNRGRSHSLLNQLNLLNNMDYVDSGVRRELLDISLLKLIKDPDDQILSNSPSETGLVIPGIGQGKGRFMAPLRVCRFHPKDPRHSCIVPARAFDDWWLTPFIETSKGKVFSRSDVVLIMADQDGGAHVDKEIDADFSDFCQDFYFMEAGTNLEPMHQMEANIVAASIRQIAFELMATIDKHTGSKWVEQTGYCGPDWHEVPRPMALIVKKADLLDQ